LDIELCDALKEVMLLSMFFVRFICKDWLLFGSKVFDFFYGSFSFLEKSIKPILNFVGAVCGFIFVNYFTISGSFESKNLPSFCSCCVEEMLSLLSF
jgi:hypothetical protein